MADSSNPSPADGRAMRQDLLLRRLAQMLEEMRAAGIVPPAAFAELAARGAAPAPPGR